MAQESPTSITRGAESQLLNEESTDNINELSQAEPSGEVLRHPEFFFNDTLVFIQAESTLFSMHQYQFVKSELFLDMLEKPRAKGDEPEEGSSTEHPIVLKGVAASHFAALMKVLYTSYFSISQPVLDASIIIPAFRLANILKFPELRKCLLPYAEKYLGDVDRILLAREFGIQEWLAPAYISLCRRESPPSVKEARQLGFEGVLLILQMQAQYHNLSGRYCSDCIEEDYSPRHPCSSCGDSNVDVLYVCRPLTNNPRGRKIAGSTTKLDAEVKAWVENGCKLGNE